MVLVQKWPFLQLFFLQIIGQVNVFYDILKRQNAFLGYKTRSSKSRKIDIFPKELTHGFAPKINFFQLFFLRNIDQQNVFYDNLEKIDIFRKGLTHGFGPKMTNFPTFFFDNIGQENIFYDILKQKNSFLGYKNKKFKKSKN